ncbi:MAG: DUF4276 family protein [Phycisphaerae bacterium]|nr:DUF4276 family protein [Phycisphaerae bacterium]
MTNLVIFTEEESAKTMLEELLPRLLPEGIYYRCVAFEGKQDLEKQLPRKLRGWRTPNTKFVVLRDQDRANCKTVKNGLIDICRQARKQNVLIRVVCRELESWYLADLAAVEKGLGCKGLAKKQMKDKYRSPDDITNPKEELRKLCKYQPISSSRAISPYLDLDNCRSRSFKHFISGVRRLCGAE